MDLVGRHGRARGDRAGAGRGARRRLARDRGAGRGRDRQERTAGRDRLRADGPDRGRRPCGRARARPAVRADLGGARDRTSGTVGQARTLALADRYGVAYTRSACSIPERTNAAERYRFHRVQRAFVELLGPSALLFDDVQWADDASLELLLHLLTRPPEVPHLLVFALRPATVAARCSTRPAAARASRSSRSGRWTTPLRRGRWSATASSSSAPRPASRSICRAGSRRRGATACPRRCRRRSSARSTRSTRRRAPCCAGPRSPATRSTRSSRPPPRVMARCVSASVSLAVPRSDVLDALVQRGPRPAAPGRAPLRVPAPARPARRLRRDAARRGASPRTSASRPRWSGAAPARRRGRITSRGSPAPATARRSSSCAGRRRPRRGPLPRRPRTGTPPRCHSPRRRSGRRSSARWRCRSPARADWKRASRASTRRSRSTPATAS